MARHNRIELNDFDDDKKKLKKDKYEEFAEDKSFDSDFDGYDNPDADDDLVIKDTVPRYRRAVRSALYNEKNGDVFEDDFYGEDEMSFDDSEDSGFDSESGVFGEGAEMLSQAEGEISEEELPSHLGNRDPALGPVLADFDDDEDDMFNPKNKEIKANRKKIIIAASVAGGVIILAIVVLFATVL
ncbi:MAG: hypothetical protein IJX24_01625, partial [Oscillospiraceae bacterium]|nr:hypothetical protein [Oscillospiraceae bacterium]